MAFVLLASAAMTQTMNVVVGQVDYVFPAAQTGDMTYDTANTLTIGGRTFDVNSISSIFVDDAAVDDNTVVVNYDGSQASVVVAGNIARFVDASVTGADVQITQADEVSRGLPSISTTASESRSNSWVPARSPMRWRAARRRASSSRDILNSPARARLCSPATRSMP